jgi:hypothetical protein
MASEAEMLVAGVNALFLGCCVWVWRELGRRGINGACCMCLALLVAARLTDWGPPTGDLQTPVGPWRWGLGVAFGFMLLCVLHHLGELIAAARAQRG